MSNPPKKRILLGTEWAILGMAGVYLVILASEMTTFFPAWPIWFKKTLLVLAGVCAGVRALGLGPRQRPVWIAAGLAAVYGLAYWAAGYSYLLYFAVFTVGLIDVDVRKVLRVYLVAVGATLAGAVLVALAGGIANCVYYRHGVKSSWGTVYPTDFSSLYLMLMIWAWVAWREAPDWALLLPGLSSVGLALWVTRSRNSLACSLLFCGAVAAHGWLERARRRRKGAGRWLDGALIAAFPLCAAAVGLMVLLYARGTSLGVWLNDVSSDRLRLSLEGVRNYGVTAFGASFEQVGYGLSMLPPKGYNFIDSSFVLILLRHGWVTGLAMCAAWCFSTRRAIRAGQRRLALALALVAVHSVLEHHFIELHFNPMLMLPLAMLPPAADAPPERAAPRVRRGYAASALTLTALLAAAWLLLPGFVSRLRTICAAKGWQGGSNALPALALALLALGMVGVAARAMFALLCARMERKGLRRAALVALAACLALGVAGRLWGDRVIDAAARANAALVDADAPALEVVLSAAKAPVYVDPLPEVYRRRFSGIGRSALPGDDLARLAPATAILDAGTDHPLFFMEGFRFTQVSDSHAVYTSDPAVASALEAAGYPVDDHWSAWVPVDLNAAAALNGLPFDGEALQLDGPLQSLASGPYADLYDGRYEVEYTLALPDAADRSDGTICRLRVAADWGEKELADLSVSAAAFADSNPVKLTLAFDAQLVRAVEFLAISEADRPVNVRGIRYRKTGTLP